MAAIDKLYLNDYSDYDQLRKWSIVYYPELLFYMYSTTSYTEWVNSREAWVETIVLCHKKDLERFGKFENEKEAINNLIKHYKKTANYDCSYKQAKEEYLDCMRNLNKSKYELELEYRFPVMNTPLSVDRKLKWICPVPCVREYLHKQCGVNPKWEWLYRLFWKGKKHF